MPLLPALLFAITSSQAATVVWQGDITGGVSVDATGASTPYDGSSAWTAAEEGFEILLPSTATVTEVYAVLLGKWSGFYGDPAAKVEINGVDLTSATLVDAAVRTRVYALDPATYGITGAGSYSYAETGSADSGYQGGYGVGGTTLVVLWEDTTLAIPRHVAVLTDELYGTDSVTLTDLPTDSAATTALLSLGMLWECSDEQNAVISADSVVLTSWAGGRDDGKSFATSCGYQDWNSLITQGSFGYDDTGTLVGVDGDDPWTEPGGTAYDSRLSDELWEIDWYDAGELEVGYQ